MIYPWIEATGCCTLVLDNLENSVTSWEQVGVVRMAERPEEANLLIVGGWINQEHANFLKEVYSRMPKGKQVVAVGACSLSASVFEDLKDLVPAKKILPVHYNVTGCPPRWDDVLRSITRVTKAGEQEKTVKEILNDTGSDVIF